MNNLDLMNVKRTGVIATNVFREVIRDRVWYLVVFFTVAFGAAAVLLPEVAASTEAKMTLDVGLAGMSLFSVLVAIFIGTGLINKEIEKRTVFVMIAKPISRAEFIVGKHWGLSAVLAVLVLAMTLVYLAILSANGIEYSIGSILLSNSFLWLELSLMTAIAILFGVFTSSLLAVLLSFAVYLMGHFSRDLVSLGHMAKNAVIRFVTEGLYLVLPDLARLNLKNQAVYGFGLLPQPPELLANVLYGLIYIVVILSIASAVFSRREF